MPRKERIEDLGQIYAMLRHLMDDEFFEERTAPKWLMDQYLEMKNDEKEDFVRALVYGREMISHRIWDVIGIARGDDE